MMFVWFIALACIAAPAHAYVGPGAAITVLGSLLGFSSLVILGVVFSFAWPIWMCIKIIRRKMKSPKPPSSDLKP